MSVTILVSNYMLKTLSSFAVQGFGRRVVESCVSHVSRTPYLKVKVKELLNRLWHAIDTDDPEALYSEKVSEQIPDAAYSHYRLVLLDKDLNQYAVMLLEKKYILTLFVGDREKALEWAKKHRFQINSETGEVQTYETPQLLERTAAENSSKPLFANLTDDQLMQLGVPQEQLPNVRSICSAEELDAAECKEESGYLLPVQYRYLSLLAQGKPYEDTYNLFCSERRPKKALKTLSDVFKHSSGKAGFTAIESADDIERITDAAVSLEEWRIFLHPGQQHYVDADYNGPVLLLGGAGTGKTVVAMHRARRLAKELLAQERADGKKRGKVLFTTYTKTLIKDIETNLRKLCTEEEMEKIKVATLDSCAMGTLKKLDPSKFAALNAQKEKNNAYFAAFREECLKTLEAASSPEPQYAHVIVDEVQDFDETALKLFRALAGAERVNDLFLTGDTRQDVYSKRKRPVLRDCGIKITGRSFRLRLNYRTTEEIRDFAADVLKGMKLGDMDGGSLERADNQDDAQCISLRHGKRPLVRFCPTEKQQMETLVDYVRILQMAHVPESSICVVASTKNSLDEIEKAMKSSGIGVFNLSTKKDGLPKEDEVRVATIMRAKGLEFGYIIVADADPSVFTGPDSSHGKEINEKDLRERCSYYVAMTRARDGLCVLGVSPQKNTSK